MQHNNDPGAEEGTLQNFQGIKEKDCSPSGDCAFSFVVNEQIIPLYRTWFILQLLHTFSEFERSVLANKIIRTDIFAEFVGLDLMNHVIVSGVIS